MASLSNGMDEFDPQLPNHYPTTNPMVRKTRIYRGYKIALMDPYAFWKCEGRVDDKPLHPSLIDCQFTTIEIMKEAVDLAIKEEERA